MPTNRQIPLRRAVTAALAVGMVLSLMPATAAADSDVPDSVLATEWAVLGEVNRIRGNRGLAPLRMAEGVRDLARERSRSMKRLDYFGHVTPGGQHAGDLLSAAGIGYRWWGEVIGWTRHLTLAQGTTWMVDWWLNSPDHRGYVLSERYNYAGVGVAQDGPLTLWTIVFVSQADHTAPVAGLVGKKRSRTAQVSATIGPTTTSLDGPASPAAVRQGLGAENVRVSTAERTTIRWWGRDRRLVTRTSGLHSFTLQHRYEGEPWHTLMARTTARFGTWAMRPGVHTFRIKARDRAGNTGDWQRPLWVIVR
jgi:uncharacterized protein YkwD